MSIDQIIDSRRIEHLVHFTPFPNLLGVFECGGVIPRKQLVLRAREMATRGEDFLMDYISFNDAGRYDGRTDCVNLSVQHPNIPLLSTFRSRFPHAAPWFVLLLDPLLCRDDGVVFTTGNAASAIVRNHGSGSGADALERLFAPCVITGNIQTGCQELVRSDTLPACHPTNPQAEVLYPGTIPLDRIKGIAAETPDAIRQLQTTLLAEGVDASSLTITLQPERFKRR